MTLDVFIVTGSIVEFLLFLGFHLVISRHKRKEQVFKWLTFTFLSIGILIVIIEWLIFSWLINSDVSIMIKSIVISLTFLLYALGVFIYSFSVFAAVETAIRTKLIYLINQAGDKGIVEKEIIKNYNKKFIIQKRLNRLISSGELSYTNNKYRIKRRWSLIFLPVIVVKIMWQVYGVDNNIG